MKFKTNLFLISSFCLYCFVIFLYLTNSFNKKTNYISENGQIGSLEKHISAKNHFYKNHNCDDEWVKLNKYVYLRNQMSFYFVEKQKIEIYVLKWRHYNLQLSLKVWVDSRVYDMKDLEYEEMSDAKIISVNSNFTFGYLMATIQLNQVTILTNITACIRVENYTVTMQIPIKMNLKAHKDKSLVCTKLLFFDDDKIKTFQWWIEMTRLNGFDKLVFYNNSLSSKFNFLIEKYSNFIDIVQLTCIPNLFDPEDQTLPFLRSLIEVKKYNLHPLETHDFFMLIVQNECYLNHKEEYKHIAIFDQDEIVLKNNIYDSCLNISIDHYLESVKKGLSQCYNLDSLDSQPTSFYFKMALYLDTNLVYQLFENLENYFEFNLSYEEYY